MKLSLLTEGSSDVALLKPLRWLINDIDRTLDYGLERVDFAILPNPPRGLDEKIARAVLLREPDILLVHRDADSQGATRRHEEIGDAIEQSGVNVGHVAVVPVTMTESWFMFDEPALRKAAGNPKGTARLELPEPERLRSKNQLFEQLRIASGKSGRHLRKVRPEEIFHVLVETIVDFSPLDELASFRKLRADLESALLARQAISPGAS